MKKCREEEDLEEVLGLASDLVEEWATHIHSAGTSHGSPEGGGLECTYQWFNRYTQHLIMAIPMGGGYDKMSGMGRGGGRGQGQGRMGGSGLGPGGECRCPQCGNTMPHQVGVPCYQQTCPKCGSKMMRP